MIECTQAIESYELTGQAGKISRPPCWDCFTGQASTLSLAPNSIKNSSITLATDTSSQLEGMFSSSKYDRFDGGERRGGRGRDRGSGRGRGRSGYSATRTRVTSTPVVPEPPSPPMGPVMTTIQYRDLTVDDVQASPAKITGLEDVASYNWLDASEPTILTPGISHHLSSSRVLTCS